MQLLDKNIDGDPNAGSGKQVSGMFLEAIVEDEWFVFEKFLYSERPTNLRSSFWQVGETNAEQMALGGLEKWNPGWQSKGGELG